MITKFETRIIKSADECRSFAEKDLFELLRNQTGSHVDIVCIDSFEVEKSYRGKGYGKEFLKSYAEEIKHRHVLLLIAGVLIEEGEEPSEEEIKMKLQRLKKFYTSIGFVDVNENIGQYEHKIAFVYDEGIGAQIVSKLTMHLDGEKKKHT